MLRRVHVQNFKSITDLTLEPGLVNVLIGENGCGKSNFLEALAFASAATRDRLDNEFLTSRGIRVAAPEFMRSAFSAKADERISFDVTYEDENRFRFDVWNEKEGHYPHWVSRRTRIEKASAVREDGLPADGESQPDIIISKGLDGKIHIQLDPSHGDADIDVEDVRKLHALIHAELVRRRTEGLRQREHFSDFLVYSPENTTLRTFAQEGQVLPLGIKGEGLFKLLRFLSTDEERWEELRSNLKMLDWFRDLKIAPEQAPFEQTLQIQDRFLSRELAHFDQRSANEGFLFLLFYISLIISPDTPTIFAIDNIDVSLNPKTATALTSRLANLAKKYKKQIFLTTHSPAVLDGLDLTDPEHRLFVFQRNRKGETRCRRVTAPQPVAGETPVKLSEAFLRGLIGGLPQNF